MALERIPPEAVGVSGPSGPGMRNGDVRQKPQAAHGSCTVAAGCLAALLFESRRRSGRRRGRRPEEICPAHPAPNVQPGTALLLSGYGHPECLRAPTAWAFSRPAEIASGVSPTRAEARSRRHFPPPVQRGLQEVDAGVTPRPVPYCRRPFEPKWRRAPGTRLLLLPSRRTRLRTWRLPRRRLHTAVRP